MNNRKYKTSPEVLLNEGKNILSESEDSKYHFKVFAVNMVLSGCKASYISNMAGISRMSVSSWVKTADEKGFDALKSRKHQGRPGKLSSEQREKIDKVLQRPPNECGFKVWDGPSLAAFVSTKFSIAISVRQCQRLMHSLGYSRIRPQSFPSKGYEDTEARNDLKKKRRGLARSILDYGLSGRGPLPGPGNGNSLMVQKRKCTKGKIDSWTLQGLVFWFCHTERWKTVRLASGKIYL